MGKHRRSTLLTVTSALLALAPKCPVCFLAYFGIFGVTAASASAYRSWLPPLTAISLAVTVGTLGLRDGSSQRKFGPVVLGVIAASGVFAGRFVLNSGVMLFGSLLILLASVLWKFWRRRRAADDPCILCEPARDASAWPETQPRSCAHQS